MRFTREDIDNINFDVIEKVFKKKLPSLGFNIRQPQLEMANEILEMVKNRKKCLVVEAGVGTGKSFGYLIPLLVLQNRDRYGFSIIVSTGTISLQEQLIKDLSYLKQSLNLSTNVVLAKGNTHFLCLDRLSKQFSKVDKPSWIEELKDYSEYGDRAELENLIPQIDNIWGNINVQNCKFRGCNFYDQCGHIRLREVRKKSNSVIVTNHDQLIANAKAQERGKSLFPSDTEMIVVDEAHNLEEKARNSLSLSWNLNSINSLLRAADKYLQRSDDYKGVSNSKKKTQKSLNQLFHILQSYCNSEARKNEKYGNDTQKYEFPFLEKALLEELKKELKSYSVYLQLLEDSNDELDNVIDLLEELISFFETLYIDVNKIFWLEMKGTDGKNISLNSVPKEMDEIIHSYFFSKSKAPMILTSGTISQQGGDAYQRYEYLLKTLGIDLLRESELALSAPKISPFNYDENAILYISSNLPSPKEIDKFRKHAILEIINLLKLTDGRSLILFTSKSDMQFVHSQLILENLPWTLLVQKEGSSQEEVKKKFSQEEKSVLLSTGIFWEGMDIAGPSLSNLIIFKLPFSVPDPILKYKASLSDSELMEVYVPEMIIKLRQGLGRLIRKETDKGIVTILDSRISSVQNKIYRNTILEVIPFKNVTESFQEVEKFVKDVLKL